MPRPLLQAIHEFFRGRVQGDTDLSRTLARLGYSLQFQQHPTAEMDWSVTNLAVDLRDGLRLCKLAAVLTAQPALFDAAARFPADRRPVRLANVALALQHFAMSNPELLQVGWRTCVCVCVAGGGWQGCTPWFVPFSGLHARPSHPASFSVHRMPETPSGAARRPSFPPPACVQVVKAVEPAEIVDGDRARTMSFLWRLIVSLQLPRLVDRAAIIAEVARLRRMALQANRAWPGGVLSLAAAGGEGADLHALLLQWVQGVCCVHGVRVSSLGTAFADGRAPCILVNHYLGGAFMPAGRIYVPDVPPPHRRQGVAPHAAWVRRHGEGVARNYAALEGVAAALGEMPPLLSAAGVLAHGVDDEVAVLYSAFLCRRLMEVSQEERAALTIQRLWRRRQAAEGKQGAAWVCLRFLAFLCMKQTTSPTDC